MNVISRAGHGVARAYFLAHVDDETDECIVWPFGTSGRGYGVLRFDGTPQKVHALACIRHNGPIPQPGMVVRHLPGCTNRRCFNWRHLSWGTRWQVSHPDSQGGNEHDQAVHRGAGAVE